MLILKELWDREHIVGMTFDCIRSTETFSGDAKSPYDTSHHTCNKYTQSVLW